MYIKFHENQHLLAVNLAERDVLVGADREEASFRREGDGVHHAIVWARADGRRRLREEACPEGASEWATSELASDAVRMEHIRTLCTGLASSRAASVLSYSLGKDRRQREAFRSR